MLTMWQDCWCRWCPWPILSSCFVSAVLRTIGEKTRPASAPCHWPPLRPRYFRLYLRSCLGSGPCGTCRICSPKTSAPSSPCWTDWGPTSMSATFRPWLVVTWKLKLFILSQHCSFIQVTKQLIYTQAVDAINCNRKTNTDFCFGFLN